MKLLYSILSVAIAVVSIHAKITPSELADNKAKGLHLISLKKGVDPIWKTEDEMFTLAHDGIKFFDVTEVYDLDPDNALSRVESTSIGGPYRPPTHQAEVEAIITDLSLPNIKSYVDTLTKFNNRYPNQESGVVASNWILRTAFDIISKYPESGATVKPFHHTWNQSSVIVNFPGAIDGPITIVGAHLDSFNTDHTSGRAPGADDDATGCASLLEVLRALLAGDFQPSRPVEFHWYSAQFIGNIGSLNVAKSYKDAGKQ
ncbi:hypothetical protein C0991_012008, partial [Blastosporella zonata]